MAKCVISVATAKSVIDLFGMHHKKQSNRIKILSGLYRWQTQRRCHHILYIGIHWHWYPMDFRSIQYKSQAAACRFRKYVVLCYEYGELYIQHSWIFANRKELFAIIAIVKFQCKEENAYNSLIFRFFSVSASVFCMGSTHSPGL